MTKIDYVAWLIKCFSKSMEMPIDAIHRDFFKEEWLDSFKTLELITEIETTFDIILSDSAFNDPRFSTIAGLAEILTEIKEMNRT